MPARLPATHRPARGDCVPSAVGVVLPAHNEEHGVLAAVRGLQVAAAHCPLPVHVVLVLDSCTDGTAARLDESHRPGPFDSVTVVITSEQSVGAARRLGADALLRDLPADRTWLATTDADSVVPPRWLTRQLEYSTSGANVVAGTVRIASWPPGTAREQEIYRTEYERPIPHGHIHGANLGIDSAAYCALGGFVAKRTDEDVALVQAAVAADYRVQWAVDIPVVTSGRLIGRAPLGLADRLSEAVGKA